MNIYDVSIIENEIEFIAQNNDGEVPEEKFQELIEAQTKSVEQIDRLCQYIKFLEMGIDNCKAEEKRISEMRKKADNKIESIKKYLLPFFEKKGKLSAGTFTLSTRKSESVELADDFFNPVYSQLVQTYIHNKADIKQAIKNGIEVPGAQIIENQNLQIKWGYKWEKYFGLM